MSEHRILSVELELNSLRQDGEFQGLAAVYDVEDLQGDVIDPGAFARGLQKGGRLPLFWQTQAGRTRAPSRASDQGDVHFQEPPAKPSPSPHTRVASDVQIM